MIDQDDGSRSLSIEEVTKLSFDHTILFYDGVCHLCNDSVNWLIKRDVEGHFLYAPLQSNIGSLVRSHLNLSDEIKTVVAMSEGVYYQQSDVTILIGQKLHGRWSVLKWIRIVPRVIRNCIYGWIAKNRYQWYGKSDVCMIPKPEWNNRFIGASSNQ